MLIRLVRCVGLASVLGAATLLATACADDEEPTDLPTVEATSPVDARSTATATTLATSTSTGTATGTSEPTATPTGSPAPGGGEAAAIVGVTWVWTGALLSDGTELVPNTEGDTTLVLDADGTAGAMTDCNSFSGTYELDGSMVAIDFEVSTLIGCPEESTQDDFVEAVESAVSWTVDGETLRLGLPDDAGTITFVRE